MPVTGGIQGVRRRSNKLEKLTQLFARRRSTRRVPRLARGLEEAAAGAEGMCSAVSLGRPVEGGYYARHRYPGPRDLPSVAPCIHEGNQSLNARRIGNDSERIAVVESDDDSRHVFDRAERRRSGRLTARDAHRQHDAREKTLAHDELLRVT